MSTLIAVRTVRLNVALRLSVSAHLLPDRTSAVELVLERRSNGSNAPDDFHAVGTPVRFPAARLEEAIDALRAVAARGSNAAIFAPPAE